MSYTITLRPNDNDDALIPTMRATRPDETIEFRLLDADGIAYFQGVATDDFAILAAYDRYSESMGCTQAQWWNEANGGAWVDLN